MLDIIKNNTCEYMKLHEKESRKKKGQFFTSEKAAKYMAKKASYVAEHLSILEPGAGNGMLAAAVVQYCIENRLCSSFDVKYIENDKEVLRVLENTVKVMKEYVEIYGGKINVSISQDNYITEYEGGEYDIVICNPPYKKIRKDSKESMCMKDYVYGQPNLYSLFMCKAVKNLRNGGHFVFITPRSWTSGSYYMRARKYILESLNISDLLIYERRDNVFNNEDVLQETLITVGVKGEEQTQYINLYNTDINLEMESIPMRTPSESIKGIGNDKYLLLPANDKELRITMRMSRIKDTFESLGYSFKTGPVVEFRNKSAISSEGKEGYIPMFRSANIVDGQCVFPAETDKAQYVDVAEHKLLLLNRNTVFLRRLSAKEERRRLQSCVYYQRGEHKYISVENHVNYLVRVDGTSMSTDEVEWINGLLMSDDYDVYYRVVNGSTQVNAGELNKLPVQRRNLDETKCK